MSIITAKGKKAGENAQKETSSIDFKEAYIKLKDGESVKVRLLSAEDYVEYKAHGSYAKGIFTQPCIASTGEKCALCEASNYEGGTEDQYGKPEWNHLYARPRYLFAFADIGKKTVRLFDATKNQAKGLISAIEEYGEDIADIAFTFKRVGNKTDTTYSLNPILKMKGADKEGFDSFEGQEVEVEFFEKALFARTREKQIEELRNAGFPVAKVFGKEGELSKEDESTPLNDGEVAPEDAF